MRSTTAFVVTVFLFGSRLLPAQASGIANSTLLGAGSCVINGPPSGFPCPAPVGGVYTLTPTSGFRLGLSSSHTTSAQLGGPLKASVSISNTSRADDLPVTAISRAAFYDGIFVTGPNAPSTLRFAVSADGSGATTSDFQPNFGPPLYAAVSIFNCGSAAAVIGCNAAPQFIVPANTGVLNGFLDVPVIGGWNNLYFNLSAVAILGRPSTVSVGQPWTGTASSDFSNTVNFTGLQFLDAAGNDITSSTTASFSSGTSYAAIVTPEPTTWLLQGVGLLAIGIAVRRKRRNIR